MSKERAPHPPILTVSSKPEVTDKKSENDPSYTKNIRISGIAKIRDEDTAKKKSGRIAIDVFNETDYDNSKQYRKLWGEAPTNWNKKTGEWYYDKPAQPGKEYEFTVRASIGEAWAELDDVKVEGVAEETSDFPWMNVAKGEIELKVETDGDNDGPKVRKYLASCGLGGGYRWCGAFAYWCFKEGKTDIKRSDFKENNPAWVEYWKYWGTNLDNKPALGSVMVIKGGGESHVGFVAGKTSTGSIVLLGGNQSDSVNYQAYKTTNLACYVFPKNYTPNYDVPTVKIINNGKDIDVFN